MTLYTYDQLSALLGVSRYTVQELIRAGEFGDTVNVARQHLVTQDGLDGFITSRTGPAYSGKRRTEPRRSRRHEDPGPL